MSLAVCSVIKSKRQTLDALSLLTHWMTLVQGKNAKARWQGMWLRDVAWIPSTLVPKWAQMPIANSAGQRWTLSRHRGELRLGCSTVSGGTNSQHGMKRPWFRKPFHLRTVSRRCS